MKATLILCAALTLNGCVSTEEIRARDLSEASGNCSAFGYTQGTSTHAQCMQMSFAQKQQVRDNAHAAASSALIRQGSRIYHGTPRVNVYHY